MRGKSARYLIVDFGFNIFERSIVCLKLLLLLLYCYCYYCCIVNITAELLILSYC